jgi:hypothetical protein
MAPPTVTVPVVTPVFGVPVFPVTSTHSSERQPLRVPVPVLRQTMI